MDDIDRLLMNLQLYYNKQLKPRQSLIVFDEIQDSPKAREAIKFLVADGRFDYIETGSLVSIRSKVKGINIPSEEDVVEMFPLDFEEFLWAMGNDMLMTYIKRLLFASEAYGTATASQGYESFSPLHGDRGNATSGAGICGYPRFFEGGNRKASHLNTLS